MISKLFGESMESIEFSELVKMPILEQQYASLTPLEKSQVALLMAVCHPKIVVETGVWCGRTTRFMSEFLSLNQIEGQVYAFDLPEILDELKRGDSWFDSAQNVTLVPGSLPGSLVSWLHTHDQPVDFALVDAHHSFHAVMKELDAISPRLSEHGYILCHDYGNPGSKYEGVMCAVNESAKKYNLAILPLRSAPNSSSERFCQAAILHKQVKCPMPRRLFHWRKYLAQEAPALASVWGRVRHLIFGD
jgi:hypothetical protein